MATKKVTTHSKNFDKVKQFYDWGCWSKNMIKQAVVKGWITATEYKEITGEKYTA